MSDSAQPSPLPPPSSLQPTVLSKPAAASMPQDEVAQSFSNPPNEITVQSVSSKKQDLQDSKDQDDVFVAGILSIEASPAFKILDQLRNNREISLEKCEILKQKHQTLYQYFLTSFEYEKATLKRVKQLQQDVQKQRVELDKTGTKAFHDNAEIGELKRELLKCQNEVTLAQDMEVKLAKEIEEACLKKQELIEDIEDIRKHKADMLEPQLVASTKELKLDLIQRKHQVENLEKDLEEKQASYDAAFKERERLEAEKEKQEIALANADEMPQKILKQSEVLRDAVASLVMENTKQHQTGLQLDKEFERLQKKRKEAEDEKVLLAAEFERKRCDMHDVERHCDDIYREHELAKDQVSIQQAEKVRIVMAIERVINEIKQTHDHHIRLIREKETNLKQYARISTSLNNMISSLPPMESQVADIKSKLLVAQRDKRHYKSELKRLRQEIDCLCHSFLEGERKLGNLQELAGTRSLQNSDLERELDRLENRTENNEKIVSALEDEKEKKLRELLRLESKLRKIKENLNSKEFQMLDASKRAQEMAGRLKDFATLYENVKNERNRYVNLLQPAQQRLTEMKEKIKIISGEIEILRNEVYQKTLELNKRRQENIAKYSVRDNTRMEANQLLAQFRQKREQIDFHLNQIEILSNSLTIVSDDLQSIRERYESAIQDRNKIGIALLERNDELCILYEKSNVQESVLRSGIDTLNKREEVNKEFNLIKTELVRTVEHKRRLLPIANALEKEMSDLLQEVKKTKAKVEELGAKTESPIEPDRIRMLEGADPTQTEMIEKLKHLEERLALKEEKLLEKSLILEEVTNLTERLQKQAIDNRLENTELMTKLNELTRKINAVNKSMLAKLSELSMNQALSLALQKDQTTKEHLLHSARERLAHNQLPIEEFEQEFIKFEKLRQNRMDQLRQQLNLQERDTVGAENGDRSAYVLPGGGKTTAEQRPNAYIPSSDTKELPLPKPYGAFGPFKPTDVMGGNLGKYYKKMIVKPVEI